MWLGYRADEAGVSRRLRLISFCLVILRNWSIWRETLSECVFLDLPYQREGFSQKQSWCAGFSRNHDEILKLERFVCLLRSSQFSWISPESCAVASPRNNPDVLVSPETICILRYFIFCWISPESCAVAYPRNKPDALASPETMTKKQCHC